jgi:hypothetical protein
VFPVPVPVFPLRPVFIVEVFPVRIFEFKFVAVYVLEFIVLEVLVPVEVLVVIVVFVFMFVFMFELRAFELVLLSPHAIAPTAVTPRTAVIRIFFINSPVVLPANFRIRPLFLSKF